MVRPQHDALPRRLASLVKVTFKKIGERRYGVFVEREHAPTLMMQPAPGYDDFLPHDLLHFVAEAEWGLDGAVFGQLAAGGDAGTFWPIDKAILSKMMRRRRKQRSKHYKGPRRSELLAGVLESAWNARRGKAPLPVDWSERLAAARVEPERLDQVIGRLDDLAARWHLLRIGDPLTLEWPRPERRPHRRPSRTVSRAQSRGA
jgi:hypothetical protein